MKSLEDRFGRIHRTLRVSVTDRCQMRCRYCLPNGAPPVLPKTEILTFEEIALIIRVASELGITRIRLTGGEPLLRKNLAELVRMIRGVKAIETIALTTNALLLERNLSELVAAGLDQVSISIDTVEQRAFEEITGLDSLSTVLCAIDGALAYEQLDVELNAVAVRDFTESAVIPLMEYGRERNIPVRFIEIMPFEDIAWNRAEVLSGAEIERIIIERYGSGSYIELDRSRKAAPARRFRFKDGRGGFGLIEPVTRPFCSTCDRLRTRADGMLFNCLFDRGGHDLRVPARTGDRAAIAAAFQASLAAKGPGGMLEIEKLATDPPRVMASIGG